MISNSIYLWLIDNLIDLYTLLTTTKDDNFTDKDSIDQVLRILTVDKIINFDQYCMKKSLLSHFLKTRGKFDEILCFLAGQQGLANRSVFNICFILKDDKFHLLVLSFASLLERIMRIHLRLAILALILDDRPYFNLAPHL